MIITNLDFLEVVELEKTIIGGVSTFADTQTTVGDGFADGEALAIALGDFSFARSETETFTLKNPFNSISKARAEAEAIARNENSYSRFYSLSISMYIMSKE